MKNGVEFFEIFKGSETNVEYTNAAFKDFGRENCVVKKSLFNERESGRKVFLITAIFKRRSLGYNEF
jgi:hypothetical protein